MPRRRGASHVLGARRGEARECWEGLLYTVAYVGAEGGLQFGAQRTVEEGQWSVQLLGLKASNVLFEWPPNAY